MYVDLACYAADACTVRCHTDASFTHILLLSLLSKPVMATALQ